MIFLKSKTISIRNVTPCHWFPLERIKNFVVWDVTAFHLYAFLVTSKGKVSVAKAMNLTVWY
jgi:hypothetical protein